MRVISAGEHLEVASQHSWITDVLEESVAGQSTHDAEGEPGIRITIESSRSPFSTKGWEILTRESWRSGNQVVISNACSSGLDLLVRATEGALELTARWRPDFKVRGANTLLRSRAHLLIRSVLLHFPALWWSQQRGRAPLHASACTVGEGGPVVLIAGPGGVGKSTLISEALSRGARSTSDNLCVSDGFNAWGLLEPRRIPVSNSKLSAPGRKMPYGRRETVWLNRVEVLTPDVLLVLRRDASMTTALGRCDARDAGRFLTAGTYMAGELRRYWSFCATLALGTRQGEVHPPIERVAHAICSRVPCLDLVLGTGPEIELEQIAERSLVEAL